MCVCNVCAGDGAAHYVAQVSTLVCPEVHLPRLYDVITTQNRFGGGVPAKIMFTCPCPVYYRL